MHWYTIVYTRKSSEEDDRQSLSLDAQEKECHVYAQRNGITVDETHREAHSAKRPGRPIFELMLRHAIEIQQQGGNVRLLCHKPDRLLRNLSDWAKTNDLMEKGLECLFVTGSYPNNAQGKMAFGINVVFAKYYVDNLSEEVKKGFKEKIDRGEWPGPAPLGYRNANHRIELDPERAPLIKRAFEYYATGEYSLSTLCQKLYSEGLRGRQRGRMIVKHVLAENILKNPFYTGLMRFRGTAYPGSHPPIVSSNLFSQVQDVLQGKTHSRRRSHSFRYAGILCCAKCECAIIGDIKKSRYIYYRCSHRRGNCSEPYIRQEQFEQLLLKEVTRRITISSWMEEALLHYAEQTIKEAPNGERELIELEKRQRELARRLDILLDLRLDGGINSDDFNRKQTELHLTQAQVKESISNLSFITVNPIETIEWFIKLCRDIESIFKSLADDKLRIMLRTIGSNYRFAGQTINFEPVEPFKTVAKANEMSLKSINESSKEISMFELSESGSDNKKDGSFYSVRPSWLRNQAEVHTLISEIESVRNQLIPIE
jgi:DNA invertase Pin-like site-specific DNA recombinase